MIDDISDTRPKSTFTHTAKGSQSRSPRFKAIYVRDDAGSQWVIRSCTNSLNESPDQQLGDRASSCYCQRGYDHQRKTTEVHWSATICSGDTEPKQHSHIQTQ